MVKDLWRTEGLVEQAEMKSAEEAMDVYLDSLISSSLVICFNEIGDEPTCQLHDLVHDFCLIKGSEEKLFNSMSSSAPSFSSDLMSRILNVYCHSGTIGLDNFSLLSSKNKRHSGKHLYCLKISGDELGDCLSDTCHVRHLRLLRGFSLDPSFANVSDSLLNEICMLNHLRFLYIGTQVKALPLSLSNLRNLEMLVVKNDVTTLVLLPIIWDFVKLRMLSMDTCYFFDMDTDKPILIAEETKLESLRSLGKLVLSYSKDTEDIFKRIPNLQVLAFDLKVSWDYSAGQYWFPKLDFLTELQDLRVSFKSSSRIHSGPWDFHLPSNLKQLRLFQFPLTSELLSTIARLPNLEYLSLHDTFFLGEEWNIGEEDTYENLKCLKLDIVSLAKWEVGEESFPVLEKLILRVCYNLEEIPPSFGDICSLKTIQLVESPQLEDSAFEIKQYVEDMRGGDELQILGLNNIPLFK